MDNNKLDAIKKENKPIIAICYDFDNTLSPTNMQEGFIKSMEEDPAVFWNKSNAFSKENKMDINLSYMFNMKELAEGKQVFTRDNLMEYGSKIELYDGLDTWFDRINNYGNENDVIIEHYIISSGLKEMIQGCKIAKNFKEIYASSFYYNDKGVAIWPAQAINYTNKTQFLFRIEKGVLDITDPAVNKKVDDSELRVPFKNIIYIGDSSTDIPCMKLVHDNGGYSIGIYDIDKKDKTSMYEMINDGRINYFVSSSYTENSEAEILIKNIIDNIRTTSKLKDISQKCTIESTTDCNNNSPIHKEIANLIRELRITDDYSYYTYCLSKLIEFEFDENELKEILIAFNSNTLFSYALKLNTTKNFVKKILSQYNKDDKLYKHVLNKLNYALGK